MKSVVVIFKFTNYVCVVNKEWKNFRTFIQRVKQTCIIIQSQVSSKPKYRNFIFQL